MPPIFISYASKDQVFVDRLRADLTRSQIDYWIDREGLPPGTSSWERAIRAALTECESVLWIVSPAAFDSVYVRDEISIARLYQRRIYPIWAAGEHWLECVPLGTGEIQHIDARQDYDAALRKILHVLAASPAALARSAYAVTDEPVPTLAAGTEPRNPYKGLAAFSETDAGDFFGRQALVARLQGRIAGQLKAGQDRFLAVLGPSGAGKSSVVMAGLIPALKRAHPNWTFLPRILPGVHPVERLADSLASAMPDKSLSALETDLNAPGGRYLTRLATQLRGERVLLYIDQFEELFTLTADENERQQFINLITQAAADPDGKVIVLLTMRADFYGHPMNYPQLGALVTQHNEGILPMTITELHDAIEKPARLPDVGLTFDDELAAEIIFALREQDMARIGALPLLQFTLERLFAERNGTRLTFDAYRSMGGVQGAIGTHSEAVFSALPEAVQAKLGQVFLPLVNVDETTGEATRRRAPLEALTADPDAKQLVDALVTNRLLQAGIDSAESRQPCLEIAHEALFRSWTRLKDWIAAVQEDLILLRQVRNAAREWELKRRPDYLLWNQERLKLVYAMQQRLNPELNEAERDFIEPEQNRLLNELENIKTTHQRRHWIGERLTIIGDPRTGIGLDDRGLPQIDWRTVTPGGEIEIDGKHFSVKPFYVARYLLTYRQFQAFLEAPDGFEDERWWRDFPEKYSRQEMSTAVVQFDNYPRDSVSWYQSVAFTRWLNTKYHEHDLFGQFPLGAWEIRLPTEQEWQWMAQNGKEARIYPWGEWDDYPRANTIKAGIGKRSSAVGMYPHGAAGCGAVDVAGNLWEWCLNDFKHPQTCDGYSNKKSKVMRGGSFDYDQHIAATLYRSSLNPNFGGSYFGFRVVLAAPVASLNSTP